MTETLLKSSDFFIKVTMMFATFLVLIYLATVYEQFSLIIIAFLFLLAIITNGLINIISKNKK